MRNKDNWTEKEKQFVGKIEKALQRRYVDRDSLKKRQVDREKKESGNIQTEKERQCEIGKQRKRITIRR